MFKVRKNKLILLFMQILFSVVLSILLGSSWADQNSENPSTTPEAVVQKFCESDAKGIRLSSETRSQILPLVTWVEEAGDVIQITSDFFVGKSSVEGSTAKVPVEYHYVGSTNFIEFSKAAKQVRTITFSLVMRDGTWKIDEPVTAPHVHWKAAVTYLREIQRSETARSKQLETIINQVTKAAEKKP